MAGGSQNDDDGMVQGINVTPLVDVTLVLLIIFMVTAKIIVSQSLPLDLPKAAKGEDVQLIFGVEINPAGELAVNGEKLTTDESIVEKARAAREKDPDLRAVIRADSGITHGRVIRILDLLKQAGVSKIAFGVTPIAPEPGAAGGTAAPTAPPAPAPAASP